MKRYFLLFALITCIIFVTCKENDTETTLVSQSTNQNVIFEMGNIEWNATVNNNLPEFFAYYGQGLEQSFMDITACSDSSTADLYKNRLWIHLNRNLDGNISSFKVEYYKNKNTNTMEFDMFFYSESGDFKITSEDDSKISVSFNGKMTNIYDEMDKRDAKLILKDVPKRLVEDKRY
ncbi:MAG: hypothetical protein LBR28_05575 [Bacteroidales bacterium]|jgi:hypothetical protein|nr:hypothetical protein [Bacteroidales bacterium]